MNDLTIKIKIGIASTTVLGIVWAFFNWSRVKNV